MYYKVHYRANVDLYALNDGSLGIYRNLEDAEAKKAEAEQHAGSDLISCTIEELTELEENTEVSG